MSHVLSAIIAAALFGTLIKISLEPNKTTAKYYDTTTKITVDELDRALPNGAANYPRELLPKP